VLISAAAAATTAVAHNAHNRQQLVGHVSCCGVCHVQAENHVNRYCINMINGSVKLLYEQGKHLQVLVLKIWLKCNILKEKCIKFIPYFKGIETELHTDVMCNQKGYKIPFLQTELRIINTLMCVKGKNSEFIVYGYSPLGF